MSDRRESVFSAAVRWGIALGLAVAVWTMGVHLLGFYTTRVRYAQAVDTAATILPIVCVGAAILTVGNDRTHRSLSLGRALLLGAGVGAVSALITVPFLWFYHHAVNPHWVDYLLDNERRRAGDLGISDVELTARMSALRRGSTDRAQVVGGVLGSTVFATLLAAVWFVVVLVRRRITRKRDAATTMLSPGARLGR